MAVGITLEAIAAPGASPIAHNASSAKSFANDYAKSAPPNLSTRDRLTIGIIGMIHALASPNYQNNHAGLMQDATVYTGGISQFDFWTAFAGLAWSAGKTVDASLSADVPTLLKEGRDLQNKSEDELLRIIAFLAAQLGI